MKVRIILADDHDIIRAGIRKALEALDTVEIVDEVGDGPSLFQALERLRPDCVTMDVAMPEFDALTAVPHIRQKYPATKVLVVSAHDDDMYVQGLLGAGVHGYHLKDQPLSDLRLAIQRILVGEKWVSSPLLNKLVSFSSVPALPSSSISLTTRQRDILNLLQQGLDNQSIARRIGLSVKTVENHLTRLYRQLGVQSRLEAVHYASDNPEILATTGKAVAQQKTTPAITSTLEQVIILLVDDNMRYRQQLRRQVGKVCPQAMIYEAENVDSTVHTVKRVKPDLAFVDIVLGDESGIHCTRRIKAISPESRVVLMSAYPDREFHRMGQEAGAVAFLDKKDLDTAALKQVIEDVMG